MRTMAGREESEGGEAFLARLLALCVALLPLALSAAPVHAGDQPVATIEITSAISGSTLGNPLVEGLMKFRREEYLLTLRGVEGLRPGTVTVYDLLRAHDISGTFKPSGTAGELRNASGVRLRFAEAEDVASREIEIELSNRRTPKISHGHRESGVE
jgi:hypothetical protein